MVIFLARVVIDARYCYRNSVRLSVTPVIHHAYRPINGSMYRNTLHIHTIE